MKLGTLRGRAVLIEGDRAVDLGPSLRNVLAQMHTVSRLSVDDDDPTFSLEDLGPPVPDPRQVFAIGLNYAPHAAEAGYDLPSEPMVFTKFPSSVTGPVSTVTLPPGGHTDWEIEVVAVVGRGGRHIPESSAWDALAGVTLGQDLSERITQLAGRPAQFSLGKSYAGFAPIGPWIVTPDELADPDDIAFSSHLDGEPLQSGRTSEMIFSIPRLVAHISSVCELLPGDLIFTGTPEGIGNRLDPPRFLTPGETLTSTAQGIGTIVQKFSA
jgi:2-keto-4-pentenoate hydratase/2-oxohepta-3-ene-1,7-dioic acid hydratase in catechol pathway